MEYILRTVNLTKVFQNKEIVSNVNMNIKKGEIYGFLGPNGAGKTTVMKMLVNLLKPTMGHIEIFNETLNPHSYKYLSKIGVIIENPIFYNKLTCREILELHCDYIGYHNKSDISEILKLVNLQGCENVAAHKLSLGMKQRLGIARAIITKPPLLILDEPINGLDPAGIKEFRDLFKMLSSEYGITILISSHILSEIEHIADTIGIIDHGKLIQEVSMESIRNNNFCYVEVSVNSTSNASVVLSEKMNISNFKILDNNIIRIYDDNISTSKISEVFIQNNISINSIVKKEDSLEDYFFNIIKRGADNV